MTLATLENYPLVERLITEMQADAYDQFRSFLTSDELIEHMRAEYDREGPYLFARKHGLLVNESGEELAIQFMTVYNAVHPGTY